MPPVDPTWGGRMPAAPLIVRNPYLSTWSMADSPAGNWPSFWNGPVKAITGIARIDGAAFIFCGSPGGNSMTLKSRALTPTKTEYVMNAGGVDLDIAFLSPVEPGDLKRQSAPIGYITAFAQSSDGQPHTVSLYFDISGEWAHGDSNTMINWAREKVAHAGGMLTIQSVTPATPTVLAENNEYPSWGTAFFAADAPSGMTVAIGGADAMRAMSKMQGALDGSIDGMMPRAINNNWPVLAYNFDMGQVTGAATSPVTLVIGHAREPAISYKTNPVPPLWKSYWNSWQAMVADAYDDGPAAKGRADALDQRIVSDALAVSAGTQNYPALTILALRQAFGGTELVGTAQKPWMMLKEISSDGNVSTVDVIYPASPAFLYTNPYLLKLQMDPLLEYAESGTWPKVFSEHDLGSSYPNATGHDDGNEEDMPIEESADMLLMMAAYIQRAKPADAQTYATAHYKIAKQWADYLVANTLDPVNQNQTDDFTGFIDHSVNLALKGILGVGAMSIIANAAGNANDKQAYLNTAKGFIPQWVTKGTDQAGNLRLKYDAPGTWSLKYNAFYDGVLGLNLVPADVLMKEAALYKTQAAQYAPFGVRLDPRNEYTKTDWEIWTAASMNDADLRTTLIDAVYKYATTSNARVPFSDWYDMSGQQKGFQARPVQGGMFTLLAKNAKPIISP
jgi:hypothetical protein